MAQALPWEPAPRIGGCRCAGHPKAAAGPQHPLPWAHLFPVLPLHPEGRQHLPAPARARCRSRGRLLATQVGAQPGTAIMATQAVLSASTHHTGMGILCQHGETPLSPHQKAPEEAALGALLHSHETWIRPHEPQVLGPRGRASEARGRTGACAAPHPSLPASTGLRRLSQRRPRRRTPGRGTRCPRDPTPFCCGENTGASAALDPRNGPTAARGGSATALSPLPPATVRTKPVPTTVASSPPPWHCLPRPRPHSHPRSHGETVPVATLAPI